MSTLAARAELAKLALLLGAGAAELGFLEGQSESQLRRLRDAVNEKLFAEDQVVFRRLARLASRLPFWLVVPLCHGFGPLLTARVVGEMPARRAATTAVHLKPEFIASICRHLDPRRARDLIQKMPITKVIAVAQALLGQRDYATIGRFVDYLSDAAIQAVLEAVPEESELLRVAFYVDSRNRLDHLVRMLPPERRRKAILLALSEKDDLLDEILALVTSVSFSLQRELGDLAASQDETVLSRIVQRVQQRGLWGDLLPVVASLSAEQQRKVANLPLLRSNPEYLDSLLMAADRHQLWRMTLPLFHLLDEESRNRFAEAAARVPEAAIARAAQSVLIGELWEPMFDLVARMPFEQQQQFARVLRGFFGVDAALDARLILRAAAHGLEPALRQAAAP